ncbi:MAG: YciI family protein [Oscillospiraceae bacterium]|nr:YciI family protein [Oscillospiraceae bacterium]
MEFVVLGYDGTDSRALERRMAARPAHLEVAKSLHEAEVLVYAGAMLNDEENMVGSVMIVNFPSENDLREKWLNDEPFVLGNVWEKVEVRRLKPAQFNK